MNNQKYISLVQRLAKEIDGEVVTDIYQPRWLLSPPSAWAILITVQQPSNATLEIVYSDNKLYMVPYHGQPKKLKRATSPSMWYNLTDRWGEAAKYGKVFTCTNTGSYIEYPNTEIEPVAEDFISIVKAYTEYNTVERKEASK